MQTTIVKTKEAHDFLALVPQLLGFLPEKSMVLVAFRGNRTCGAMRFNLPDPSAPQKIHKRIATTLIGTLCKIPGVDAIVPVAYTDDRFAAVPGIPHERFAETLIKRAEFSGFLVRDALCVGADAWGSYLDPDCPADGSPLSDIATSSVHQAIPDDARRDLASLRSGADLPKVDLATKERLARVYRRYRQLANCADTFPELAAAVGDLRDPVETAELALTLDVAALNVEAAAALLLLIQSPGNRDQMMLQFAFGEEVGIETYELNQRYWAIQRATGRSMDDIVRAELEQKQEQKAFRDGDGGDDDDGDGGADNGSGDDESVGPGEQETGNLMLGLTNERPDPDRIERAIELLKAVVAMAPRSARPAPLCMLAWLSWALGRGSVAGIFIDQALAIDRRYSMALLLNTLFCSGHLPEWAYAVPLDAVPLDAVANN